MDCHKKSSLKSCLKLNTYQDVPETNFWILENLLWQNIGAASCTSPGFIQWWQRAWRLFFARYSLNNSAASGWPLWILISFLDLVDLVACHDGVIIYRHGQTVCKKIHRLHPRLTGTDRGHWFRVRSLVYTSVSAYPEEALSELRAQCESDHDCCFQPTSKGCLNHIVRNKSV